MRNKPILFIVLPSLLLAICCFAAGPEVRENITMESVRDALEKWVETKQLISSEKQKWQTQKEMLTERTRLLKSQADDLEIKTREKRDDIKKSEEKRAKLAEEHERLESAISLLRETVPSLESRVLELIDRLPEPAREQVRPLSQQIPSDPEGSELSISSRYQNLIGVLNFINKFNNGITLTTEIRNLGEDESVEVEVMYVGLGQAYFSNQAETVGGVGRPSPQGWKWERRDKIAPSVSSAIAIYKNEKSAEYVSLPVEIVELREGR